MKFSTILLMLLMATVGSVFGTTYYISPTGNDVTGTGTMQNPWRTLSKATNTVTTSGNTIFLLPGIYNETVQSGLAVGVNLDAADTNAIVRSTLSAQFSSMVRLSSPEGTSGNQFVRNIKFDGTNRRTSWGVNVAGRSNVSIYNCVFRNFQETAVNWSGRDDGIQTPPSIYATGNSFHHNILVNSAHAEASYGRGAFQFGGQDGMQIYNNYIRTDERPAGQNGWPIKGCNDSWIKNCRIHHNTLLAAPYPYSFAGSYNYWDFAIEIFDNIGGNIIDSNTIRGSLDINRQSKGNSAFSVWIHHNTIGFETLQAQPQAGIVLEFSTDAALVEYNTIQNAADGIVFTTRGGSVISNTTLRNNNIVNLGSLAGGRGDGIAVHDNGSNNYSINGLFIYNNTIKCLPNPSQAGTYGINFSSASAINNWRVRNNIVIGFQAASIWSNVRNAITNSFFTHNFLYQNAYNTAFTNWQGNFSLSGSNTVSNNTGGVSPNLQGGNSNTIAPGSPCIDAGINVGTLFSGAAPDVGWYEHGSIVPNVPPTANAGANQTITLPTNTATLSGSGTDTDGTITSYKWEKIIGPAAGVITNTASAVTPVTDLIQGVYQFELTVKDNSGDSAKDTIQVTVLPDPNVAPVANAGANQSIALPVNTDTLSGSGTDVDGTIAAYQWTKLAGPNVGVIVSPTSDTSVVNNLSIVGIYLFELRVTDNNGAIGRDTVQITVTPNPANIAPTANAGANQTITLPTDTASLTGIGTDVDGTIISYLWEKIAGPTAGIITDTANTSTSITGLVQGVYSFELTVTDENGALGRDTVQITVNPDPNIAPTANAGPNQIMTLPTNIITLAGSGTDPDGTIASYQWTKIAGPAAGTITNATNDTTTVTGMVLGLYRFQLKVRDNNGAVGLDTVQITVDPAPNVVPTANAGANVVITLPTNTATLNGSGNDPDGTIVGYQWTKIAGPAAGSISNGANAVAVATSLVVGVYSFELRVTDNNGAVGRDTMQVTVYPVPNVLPIANAGLDQTVVVPVNSTTLTGSGTDPDGTITAYQWTKLAGPTGGVITNAASATTTITGLVLGVYTYQLTVTDDSSAVATDVVQITVSLAPNIAPTANAGPNETITLPTNTVTLSGSGVDPDGNIIAYQWAKVGGPTAGSITNGASAVATATALVIGSYRFELTVIDNNGAIGKDTMQVTVNAAANIAPTANAGANQLINLPTNSTTLTGSGTDIDGTITAYQWTKTSGPAAGIIANATNAATAITGLVAGTYVFTLRVTDNDGATATASVTIIVNTPPVANAGTDVNITLPVNSTTLNGGASIDADGNALTYNWVKIAGPNAGSIASSTSVSSALTGLTAGVFRYELTVTDIHGASARAIVQVIVFALNVAPTANAGLDVSITLPNNATILSGSGTDIDGTIVTYLWTKVSGPAGGNITNAATAATSITGLTAGTYVYQLRVTDNSGASAVDVVQVIVNLANIPPTAKAGADQTIVLPINSVTLAGNGTDIDGTITAYNWRQISGSASKLLSPFSPSTLLVDMIAGTYIYELTVTDDKGATGKDTVVIEVKPELITTKPNSINIYPNPVINLTTLEINRDNKGERMLIVVTDINGKVVMQQQFTPTATVSRTILNFSALKSGVYFVTVDFAAGSRRTIKIIKQ
jgi:parallel beta-helix repeat protein